jgi:hypothetical protein
MNAMRLTTLSIALGLASACSLASAADVDQSSLSFNVAVQPYSYVGQSFTAGLTGDLSSIEFLSNGMIFSPGYTGPGTNTVTLDIFAGDGLGGQLLGTAQETVGTSGTYVQTMDISKLGIHVDSGQQYTFEISQISGSGDLGARGMLGNTGNPYAGGHLYSSNRFMPSTWDLSFQTTVSAVPEPGTLPLMALGLLPIAVMARRRKA